MEHLFNFIWVIMYYDIIEYAITVYLIQSFWNTYNAAIVG